MIREALRGRHCYRRGLDRKRLRKPRRHQPCVADAVSIYRHRIALDPNAITFSKPITVPEPFAHTQPDDTAADLRGNTCCSLRTAGYAQD